MRSFVKRYLLLALLFTSLRIEAKLEADEAQVLRVVDGDSISVKIDKTSYRIRFAEIDAPEMAQPWGEESKAALIEKLQSKEVAIEVIDVDRYGRLVARVFLNGRQINREMVAEGHAWVYLEYLRDQSLLRPEAVARKEKHGLWRSGTQIPPWKWRENNRP